jgi:nitroreductase
MTWSGTEIGVLARAVSHAPSVHHSQPWLLEPHTDTADLCERFEVVLPRHDPAGRDRLISCGAALANLELAVRALGWDAAVTLFPDGLRPELVARVAADGRAEPAGLAVEQYSAIFRRRSYRAPFSLHRIPQQAVDTLASAAATPGVETMILQHRHQATVLADLLGYAAEVLRDDRAYQRELTAWTAQFPEPLEDVSTLPWAGLVRGGTHLPDNITLTERLLAEGVLIVLTEEDGRRDHLLAGLALQRIWLTAITQGLVGSVLTQPLHLPEVRAGLIERLELPGYPQAVLRFGYPVTATPAAVPAAVTALTEES